MQAAHRFIFALGLAAMSASSFAATTVYTAPAPFLAQLAPGAYTESFDGLSSAPASFSGSGFSYTLSAASGIYASGTFIGTDQPLETLTISFTSGNVKAVGGNFYATDFSNVYQASIITLGLSDGTTVAFTPASSTDSYRGFVSTSLISSMTIATSSPNGASLYAGIDNLTVGVAAVPEPASLILMAAGVVGLLAYRRQRQA